MTGTRKEHLEHSDDLDSTSTTCSTAPTMKRLAVVGLVSASFCVFAAQTSSAPPATGNLDLRGSLNQASSDAPCPPGVPAASTACHFRTAQGKIPGLGDVTHSYMYNASYAPPCGGGVLEDGDVRILGYTTTFKVTGKGEIDFAVADAPTCLPADVTALTATQSFTVTGGRGTYAGASGRGRIERRATFTSGGSSGVDMWIGTVVVPGLEFDVTPPTMSGAAPKTVRAPKGAKRARVTYQVTATDNADSAVSVKCDPRSGSRFRIGRTVVKCSASDSSGNVVNAAFKVTVRPAR